jgi:heme/copper-type cytochrome/quinol oxidase subunit 2
MKNGQVSENINAKQKILIWPFYLCFLIFGILSSLGKQNFTALNFALSVLLSFVVGLLMVKLLILLLKSFNRDLIDNAGKHFAKEAVRKGMLFMIPFTVLAMLAFFILKWNAIMPFASAAITTSSAIAGAEVMQKGGKSLRNIIIPTLLGMFFSTAWMLILALLP